MNTPNNVRAFHGVEQPERSHTQLPATVKHDTFESWVLSPPNEHGKCVVIAHCRNKPTADFVALAVNAHAALVAALTDAEFLLRKLGNNWKEAAQMADSCKRSATDARTALARAAEGGAK